MPKWEKGQSGNPGGRPKNDIAAMAREYTDDALQALVAGLRNPKERIPAAIALLDRGWGKPKITVEGDVTMRSYVLRAPLPVESAAEWLRLHAPPSDSRSEPIVVDATTDEC